MLGDIRNEDLKGMKGCSLVFGEETKGRNKMDTVLLPPNVTLVNR